MFVINDACNDPRFSDNPLVTEDPNIRFYAGCPVRGPGGYRVGTLCVIDRKPREFSHEDREMLRDLAGLVEDELAVSSQAIVDELTSLANRRGFNVVAGHMSGFLPATNPRALTPTGCSPTLKKARRAPSRPR